jgi:hypothetical protein
VLSRPILAATGRIAAALSVPLTTLLIESTLNVGSDSGLSTVGLEIGEERGHRCSMSPAIRAGAQRAHFSEAAAIPLRCLDENPSSQAVDIGLRASGDRLGRMQIFDGRIGECNSERPAEHATSDKTLEQQTLKEKRE